MNLSAEQMHLITLAKEGKNVLVDACIGSGKTTTIQRLCDEMSDKHILYLTYNKLLKIDAKRKIKSKNAMVTNYHGYAATTLYQRGIRVGVSDMIQAFIQVKPEKHFDVLILDEYQDIDAEISEMLKIIKSQNPKIQIIAVGDMEQKIYDKTSLDVKKFINEFLGDYEQAYFTQCFRISKDHASFLGRVWSKEINGVNEKCKVEHMTYNDAMKFLSNQHPEEVLCLGARTGSLSKMLNDLEKKYPDVYNKNSVYASIRNNDSYASEQDIAEKLQEAAIFTTYDSSKGLERPICMIFDFTEDYWSTRSSHPQVKYDILRNIFCVAASRGKEHIVFVADKQENYSWYSKYNENKGMPLSEMTLSSPFRESNNFRHPFEMSVMFDFKYKEDIERCYSLLDIQKVKYIRDKSKIDVPSYDGFIDLSPCIGVYQEATYFTGYDIDAHIEYLNQNKGDRVGITVRENDTIDKKILRITAFDTQQKRYVSQVRPPFVSDEQREAIHKRLSKRLPKDAKVQAGCSLDFSAKGRHFEVVGRTDAILNDTVYELKFVSELQHEHFLQCACYVIALAHKGIKKGFLWNVHDNTAYEVTVPDTEAFLRAVYQTITKGFVKDEDLDAWFKYVKKRATA